MIVHEILPVEDGKAQYRKKMRERSKMLQNTAENKDLPLFEELMRELEEE